MVRWSSDFIAEDDKTAYTNLKEFFSFSPPFIKNPQLELKISIVHSNPEITSTKINPLFLKQPCQILC